jgi:hypothetical protein
MSMPDSAKFREKLQNINFLLSGSQIASNVTSAGTPVYIFFQIEGNS